MREGKHAVVAMRREAMSGRVREITPFSRYSRAEIEFMHLLVDSHRQNLYRGTIAWKNAVTLLAKLEDDLKMRP